MKSSYECEFCKEIDSGDFALSSQYPASLGSRVLLKSKGFTLLPSIGQLVGGSLLLLPDQHFERFSELSDCDRAVAVEIVRQLSQRNGRRFVLFEHGAKSSTGGGCGVYHAHLHIVPWVSRGVVDYLRAELLPTQDSLTQVWGHLDSSEEYLLFCDDKGGVWTRVVQRVDQHRFPSQYFRRRLASAINTIDWDWRTVSHPELALTNTVQDWNTARAKEPLPSSPLIPCTCDEALHRC